MRPGGRGMSRGPASNLPMQVIIFGATGMVGQGVLRECLVDVGIDRVLVVGRSPTGVRHAKLVEIIHHDFPGYLPRCLLDRHERAALPPPHL